MTPIATAEDLLAVRGQKVLLDTNILMVSDEKKKEQRKIIGSFCAQNSVCISDTVFFESLRNMNHEKFRKRKNAIRKWTETVISEAEDQVEAIFERICLLYLSVLKKDPKNFFSRNVNDLWIIAAALSEGIDKILTADDSSDFLPQLFSDQVFDLGSGIIVHLKTFKGGEAESLWEQLFETQTIDVQVTAAYLLQLTERTSVHR